MTYCGAVEPNRNQRSNVPSPRPAIAQEASTTVCPWAARLAAPPGSDGPSAIPIGRKREFISAAAPTAEATPPPAATIETAANCAEPANTIAEKAIVATIEKPASRASTPNDSDSRKPAAAYGSPALTPFLNLRLGLSGSTRRSLERPGALGERAEVGLPDRLGHELLQRVAAAAHERLAVREQQVLELEVALEQAAAGVADALLGLRRLVHQLIGNDSERRARRPHDGVRERVGPSPVRDREGAVVGGDGVGDQRGDARGDLVAVAEALDLTLRALELVQPRLAGHDHHAETLHELVAVAVVVARAEERLLRLLVALEPVEPLFGHHRVDHHAG